jgi:hypothetical protein
VVGVAYPLLVLSIAWVGVGLVMRLFQDVPMGHDSLPPGPRYDKGVVDQIALQHRLVDTWLRRLWPIPVGMAVAAIVLLVWA